MTKAKGFTLIELLIVVAVIGILTAIAMPAYRDYVTRGKIAEATSNLADMRVKLEQYYQDNRNYGSTASACGVANLTGKYFAYTCNWGAGATNQGFTATATGVAGEGMGGFLYTITHANAKATTVTGTAAAAGWTGNSGCWVTKKGGVC